MVKISIIVPIYNVEEYLAKCLESLTSQTLKDIEIICINDGSTDGSLAIVQNFAHKDKRFKVIDKKNEGVSAARNDGLAAAKGKYVMFVDGDDWIEPETCAECYEKITADKTDMLVFNFQDVYSDTKKKVATGLNKIPNQAIFSFSDCPEDFFYINTSVWGKLFKSCAFPKFQSALTKAQDTAWYWEYCLQQNPKISILNKVFYNYIQRPSSTMHSDIVKQNCYVSQSAQYICQLAEFQKASEYVRKHILDRMAFSICYEIKKNSSSLKEEYNKQVKDFLELFGGFSDVSDLKYYQRLNVLMDSVDLVYLWVDGNDKEWQQEKRKWAKHYGLPDNDADNAKCRYIDNEELRYSLRSIAQNAPWINKIYIVTNGQVPSWLDSEHPKIKIITHKQIMPSDALPTFNSEAIEACIANIPELSECFLYANDDCFIGKPVTKSMFFDDNRQPKLKFSIQHWTPEQIKSMHFRNTVVTAINTVYNKTGKNYNDLTSVHNITPYRKSWYLQCAETFKEEFDRVAHCRFRTENTVQRIIVDLYSMAKHDLSPEVVDVHSKTKQTPIAYIGLQSIEKVLYRLVVNNPTLFCINDNENTMESERAHLKAFLAALFPIKQEWEKDYGENGGLLDNKVLMDMLRCGNIEEIREINLNWYVHKYVLKILGIPLLKIRNDNNSSRAYLFKFLPLYKITHKKQKTVFKLLNFLPLLSIKKG